VETERIAIFPLSTVVLFPGVDTPLHLFEPRYRQMAADVIAGDRRIGMVAVPPEHAAGMPADPPVYPVGCMGRVARHRLRPDGRYDIVLSGERRFRIVSEPAAPAGRLYRMAEVAWLEDALPEAARPRVAALRRAITAHVRELVARTRPEPPARIAEELLPDAPDALFVNTLCNALAFAPPEKQGLLEAEDVAQRFERLEGLLAFRLAERARPGSESGRLH